MENMKKPKIKRNHPLVPVTEIWAHGSTSRYPETLRIPMDNGIVVNYKIEQPPLPHPCFLRAIDLIQSMKEGGYQYEEKPVTVTAVPAGDESNGAKHITNNKVILSQKEEEMQWLNRIRAFLKPYIK